MYSVKPQPPKKLFILASAWNALCSLFASWTSQTKKAPANSQIGIAQQNDHYELIVFTFKQQCTTTREQNNAFRVINKEFQVVGQKEYTQGAQRSTHNQYCIRIIGKFI